MRINDARQLSPRLLGRPVRRDAGMATAFAVAIFIALLGAIGLAIDGAGAAAAKVNVTVAASEAARAGADEIDVSYFRQSGIVRLNPPAAETAARAWLAATGFDGTVSASQAEVTVTAQDSYATQIIGAIGVGAFDLTATATAAPDQGDTPAASPGGELREGKRP
jgi:hypothetical protein